MITARRIALTPICCAALVSLVAVWAELACAARTFHVRPDGSDALRTLQPLAEDVEVLVAPGSYSLTNTLEFTASDSPPDGKRAVFRVADATNKPRFSAGRVIRGPWKDEGNGVFSAAAPTGNFRQIFVNGRLAVTAREPDAGEWRELKQWEPITKTLRLKGSGIMAKWPHMEQVEFVIKKHWAISRLHVNWWGTYDGDDVFAPHRPDLEFEKANVPPKNANQLYFFENALEFLDQPGEWYLDRTERRLYYKPPPGEESAKIEVVAPQLDRMIDLNGAANITFEGLVFEHANWTYPDGDQGYVGAQANVHWDGWRVNPGAIHLTHTRDVLFTNCVVRNCTAAGIVLTKGTQRTRLEGNLITGIGDTPITVYAESNKQPVVEYQCRDAQRVHVNGKDITRTDHIGNLVFTSKGPVLLGAYTTDHPGDRWRDLHGAIDDVRIYSLASSYYSLIRNRFWN